MALRERAPLGILAGQPHRMPFDHQRAECQRLGRRPVDAVAGLDRMATVLQETLDGPVRVETLRYACDLQPDLLEHLERRAGMAAARIVGVARRLDVGPAAVEPVGA